MNFLSRERVVKEKKKSCSEERKKDRGREERGRRNRLRDEERREKGKNKMREINVILMFNRNKREKVGGKKGFERI